MKRLGDVATVLLDLVSVCSVSSCHSDGLMMIRSDLCLEHWLSSDKYYWIIAINGKMNVWKCKLIFPSDTLQKNIKITDLKPF